MKTLLFFPLGMIVLIYLWAGQILPLNAERTAQAAENAVLAEEVAQQEAKINEIQSFLDSTKRFPEEVSFLEQYVPRAPEEQKTINFFSRAAAERNLQIYNMTFSEVTEGDERTPLASTSVNVQVAGTYSALFDFVQDVFLVQQLYSLESAVFEKVDEEGNADFLVLNVAFSYYVLGEDRALSPEQNFGQLSFDRVRQFQQGLKSVRGIDTTDAPQRYNPFVP